MKRAKSSEASRRRSGGNDLRPEDDFSRARPNKYAGRDAKGSIVVTLDPTSPPRPPGPERRIMLSAFSPASCAVTERDCPGGAKQEAPLRSDGSPRQSGRMFWLIWKKLVGSYLCLSATSRS